MLTTLSGYIIVLNSRLHSERGVSGTGNSSVSPVPSLNRGTEQRVYGYRSTNNVYKYMNDLTAFQRDLLYAISSKDEPHGLAIKDEIEEYYNQEVNHGRLYPNLDTLVEMGLVEKGQKDKRTNSYSMTQRGWREIEDRMEWQRDHAEAANA